MLPGGLRAEERAIEMAPKRLVCVARNLGLHAPWFFPTQDRPRLRVHSLPKAARRAPWIVHFLLRYVSHGLSQPVTVRRLCLGEWNWERIKNPHKRAQRHLARSSRWRVISVEPRASESNPRLL